jgi:hypothetical protein
MKYYPNGNYSCKEKNCHNKKRDGRCKLTEIEFDKEGNCLSKSTRRG